MRKPFSVRSLKKSGVTGKSIVLLAWWLVAQFGGAWNAMQAQTLPPSTLHGHVLHGATQQPLPDALILAWPCGLAYPANASGSFDASCPHGLDSLTVHAQGCKAQTVVVKGMTHIDVWLQPLEVMVSEATVTVVQAPEQEAQPLKLEAWTTSLDKTPGMQGLDLGAAMVQPVMRGLVGSRVTVMEDGVPQQGARWGTDHGILADPDLYVSANSALGGGHVWMGPEAMGGGIRLIGPGRLPQDGNVTSTGSQFRSGDGRAKAHVLQRWTKGKRHGHAGVSIGAFGPQNIPQTSFTYLGRIYELEEAHLPNTGGRFVHASLGAGFQSETAGNFSWTCRASDVVQGLFSGIVGVPRQGDLSPADARYEVDIPQQHASRLQGTATWAHRGSGAGPFWEAKMSGSWNQRRELAPPHAHGWGPEPTSTLSLSLVETTGFLEVKRSAAHGNAGVQLEGWTTETGGWEFLVPRHHRLRGSLLGEATTGVHRIGWRWDVVWAGQDGHEEPAYNAEGLVVGTDTRAEVFSKFWMGGVASWQRHWSPSSGKWSGMSTLAVHSRAPSSYELGANGIHHGTFRFEQGNPDLRSEKTLELRVQLESQRQNSNFSWRLQSFFAAHKDFIVLSPSASFAPISHAGLMHRFEQTDALRTGMEGWCAQKLGAHEVSFTASLLGQWEWPTGLGLPFTTPAQSRVQWRWALRPKSHVHVAARALASAQQTARNEPSTPGTVLFGGGWSHVASYGTWSLDVHNVFNTEWLDHTSAYRALGLVAQGRWAQIRFNTTLKHFKQNNTSR